MYDAAKWACDRLGVDVTSNGGGGVGSLTTETLVKYASNPNTGVQPSLVVVDARSAKNIDAEAVAR